MPRKRSIPPTFHELLSLEKARLQEQLNASHGQEEN